MAHDKGEYLTEIMKKAVSQLNPCQKSSSLLLNFLPQQTNHGHMSKLLSVLWNKEDSGNALQASLQLSSAQTYTKQKQ